MQIWETQRAKRGKAFLERGEEGGKKLTTHAEGERCKETPTT